MVEQHIELLSTHTYRRSLLLWRNRIECQFLNLSPFASFFALKYNRPWKIGEHYLISLAILAPNQFSQKGKLLNYSFKMNQLRRVMNLNPKHLSFLISHVWNRYIPKTRSRDILKQSDIDDSISRELTFGEFQMIMAIHDGDNTTLELCESFICIDFSWEQVASKYSRWAVSATGRSFVIMDSFIFLYVVKRTSKNLTSTENVSWNAVYSRTHDI